MRNYILLCIIFLSSALYKAQDTVKLKEIIVQSYLGDHPMISLPASVALLTEPQLKEQAGQSLVPALNTIAGVRMEERSMGSYRISIRGSLLRSPFGVRNIKIYVDEFSLTNAAGETYFNLLDINCMHSIEILKGPDGSLFGANTGGVIRINASGKKYDSCVGAIAAEGGSFARVGQNLSLAGKIGKNSLSIAQGFQRSDGYRQNNSFDRKYFHAENKLTYRKNSEARMFLLVSDLNYQTPGALTLQQYLGNPRASRLAGSGLPGAEEQKTRIANRTVFGGIVNDSKITRKLKHVFSLFGSGTYFENPALTNYEVRRENNVGTRSWMEFNNAIKDKLNLTLNAGGEFQYMRSHIDNYDNNQGNKGILNIEDEINIIQTFGFVKANFNSEKNWFLESSVSYNYNQYNFSRARTPSAFEFTKKFEPQFMPRLAASYLINRAFALRGIASRGYSPPSLQEIRASTNEINLFLKPEAGWNYEVGIRANRADWLTLLDVCMFYYELKEAIVRRINPANEESFVNAGTTYQTGFESQLNCNLIKKRGIHFIREARITHAFTYNYFKFGNYISGKINVSGKDLTGVPRYVSVFGIHIEIPYNLSFFTQYNYTSTIPLNDGNTESAKPYHLLQVKVAWMPISKKKYCLSLCAGIDNILNETYSLGNDLNAAGKRYYNGAPSRNYFLKISLSI